MNYEIVKVRLIKLVYITLICLIAYLGIRFLPSLVMPFLAAIAIAEIARRPIDFISKKTKISRRVCSFLVVTLAILVLLAVMWYILYSLYGAAQSLVDKAPEFLPKISDFMSRAQNFVSSVSGEIPVQLSDAMQSAPSSIIQALGTKLTAALGNIAGSLPNVFLTIAITVIAAFLVSADYYKLKQFLSTVIKPRLWDKLSQTRKIILVKMLHLLRGYGLLLVITFSEVFVALLVLGFKNALAAAVITAIIDVLPVFGAGAVLIPWAVIELVQLDFYQGIGLIVAYIVISAARNFIEPKVIGAQIKLSPLIVLVCMYIGYRLFGLFGLLLAPFAASIIRELVVQDII